MKTILSILLFLASFYMPAQEPAKKSLKIEDFAHWRLLSGPDISNNGKIILYESNPQKGDGELIIEYGNKTLLVQRGSNAQIGSENDFVVFSIKQPEDSVRKAKKDKVKKENMPVDSLGIFVFKHDTIVKFPDLISFKVPEENAEYLAFLVKPAEVKKDTTETEKPKKSEKKENQPGDNLTVFEISSGDTLLFRNVTEYGWSKNGKALYFVQQKKDSVNTFSTLRKYNAETGNTLQLKRTEGWIKKVVAANSGENYAFLHSQDTIKEKIYSLFLGKNLMVPEEIVNEYTQGIPVGWSPNENGTMYFSDDETKLFFGTAESPEPEPKDSLPEEEKPKLDIWNWQDKKLQPQQLLEAEREKKRTYLAVYHVNLERFIQLADLNIKQINTIQKGNSNVALGYDDSPYLRASSWTGTRNRDYYLVDLLSGIKREMVKDKSFVSLSPEGKFVIWYNPADSSYYAKSTDIQNLNVIPLTNMIPVCFCEETHDTPNDPRPYGIAGWSEGDKFVYIYDRYDIWKIDPSGVRVPVNMTKTFGRRNLTRLRYVKLDPELEHIPANSDILLSALDEKTISQGFFKTKLGTVSDPNLLIMEKYSFGNNVKKAKNADKIIWTKGNTRTYPDLWTSNLDFTHAKKISEINPQQNNFIWPRVEMVEWNSFSGEKLRGMLYKPDNLNEDKKYPMLVYFYERSSEGLHRHHYPRPSHSTIGIPFYTSNGYLVFVPDITYKTGYPGQSAYNAIVSGTQYLVNTYDFIDSEKMGLQGQSWGGYQTAWLITQTDLYAAAMAGAPVSNMTSAYGGIRWGSGMSRMFQYEHTQSRIGGTLWEKPLLYIENSPVFHAPKINTPLLMMHNDNDGAVPWYQGIEMFVALRRLDKPVWLLNYNGEPHNLPTKSWANRIDLSKRMFQFFNHYLKEEPMPEWMRSGVPAIDKGKNPGY